MGEFVGIPFGREIGRAIAHRAKIARRAWRVAADLPNSRHASDREIAELARLIERARQAVVFTGAGISTESGILDFRSPGEIWTKMTPIDFSDFLASGRNLATAL